MRKVSGEARLLRGVYFLYANALKFGVYKK